MDFLGNFFKSGIDGIFEGADKIIDNFVESPEQKLEAKKIILDAKHEAQKLELKAQKDLYDFSIQYEGSAAQVPKWILVLRSIIRPVITICIFFSLMIFLGLDIYQIVQGNYDNLIMAILPQAYWVILGIILGFWFGGKAGENIVEKIGVNKKK